MKKKSKDKEKIHVLTIQRDQVEFLLDDSIPDGETEYKKYLSDIALFYSMWFKDKLKHFIGLQLEQLAQFGRSDEENLVLKSNINCFRLIDEWMERQTNLHLGKLKEMRDKFQDDKEFISNFKNNYEDKNSER